MLKACIIICNNYNRGRVVNPGGYAGESGGILETIKNFPKNLKSGFEQIFSGETQAYLGDDQEKINEFLAKDMWGVESDMNQETIEMIIDMNKRGMKIDEIVSLTGSDNKTVTDIISILNRKAHGGRVGAQEGGLMSLGGMEKDYRQEGGFVPLGKKEKADDVPARLSKNEFVFTADAVRAAGGGDIDQGAEVMENMMNNLEAGGEISEESQGAQGMYDQQQMLQSRMA